MIGNIITVVEIALIAAISYAWGHLRAREQRQREDDEDATMMIPWRCDECGWSVIVPTLDVMMFIWKVHDENIPCPKKWIVR